MRSKVLINIAFCTFLAVLGSLMGLFFSLGVFWGGIAVIAFSLAFIALWVVYVEVP